MNWFKFSSPATFYPLAGRLIPYFAALAVVLTLIVLYLGFMSLKASIDDPRRAARASGLLAIVGVINVPIIYKSVEWLNTLHQGATITIRSGTSMEATMIMALIVMIFAFWMYTIAVVLTRVRCEILEEKRDTDWVAAELS